MNGARARHLVYAGRACRPPSSRPRRLRASPPVAETSLGLNRKRAAILAYSAGWVTGLLVLWLEGRDHETRWHAAQSVLGFGALTAARLRLPGRGGDRDPVLAHASSASASGRRRAWSSSARCSGPGPCCRSRSAARRAGRSSARASIDWQGRASKGTRESEQVTRASRDKSARTKGPSDEAALVLLLTP